MVLADQLTHLISVLLCLSVFHTDKAATHRALRGGLHWSRIMGLIACPSQQVANERSAKQDIWPRRYVGMVSVCVYMCVCVRVCTLNMKQLVQPHQQLLNKLRKCTHTLHLHRGDA